MYDQPGPMMMGPLSFIPIALFVLLWVALAIGFAKIAGRLGRSAALWAILSLIPVVNYFFWIYAMFVILLHVLDRLNAIGAPVEAPAATTAAR